VSRNKNTDPGAKVDEDGIGIVASPLATMSDNTGSFPDAPSVDSLASPLAISKSIANATSVLVQSDYNKPTLDATESDGTSRLTLDDPIRESLISSLQSGSSLPDRPNDRRPLGAEVK
jgi:hypothetical protein